MYFGSYSTVKKQFRVMIFSKKSQNIYKIYKETINDSSKEEEKEIQISLEAGTRNKEVKENTLHFDKIEMAEDNTSVNTGSVTSSSFDSTQKQIIEKKKSLFEKKVPRSVFILDLVLLLFIIILFIIECNI